MRPRMTCRVRPTTATPGAARRSGGKGIGSLPRHCPAITPGSGSRTATTTSSSPSAACLAGSATTIPSNPSKDAVLTANRYQMDFLEFATKGEPGRFCFIIDRGHDGAAEPRVEFLGFAPSGEVACRWVSDTVRVLRVEGQQSLAPTVQVSKPQVAPKRRDEGDAASEAVR